MTSSGIPTISLANRKALQRFAEVRPHAAVLHHKAERATHAALACLDRALAYEAAWNREAGLPQDPQILSALKNQNYEYLINIGFGFERLFSTSVFLLEGETVAAVKGKVFSDPTNAVEAQHNFYDKWLVGKYRENWKLWYYAPVGYHTLDMEGIITAINHTGAVTLLGYDSPGELIGRSIFDFVLPEQREGARQRFKAKLTGQKVPPTHDRKYVRKSKTEIRVTAHDKPNINPEGKQIGVTTALINMTELYELQAKLFELRKARGIQRLAGGLADGINNPLTGILGAAQYLEIWLSKPPESRKEEKAQRQIKTIIDSCGDAKRLVEMLVGYSGTKKSDFGEIDLRTISYYVNSRFKKPKNVELVISDAASWRIRGDDQLYEAVMNLVNNAKDAIGHNPGKIELSLRDVEYEDAITTNSGTLPPGKYVMISVEDDGVGISKADQRKIFEPFYTTKSRESRDSKGLGLAVTLGVVARSCGGGIELESEPGKGSKFTLLIPAVVPPENNS